MGGRLTQGLLGGIKLLIVCTAAFTAFGGKAVANELTGSIGHHTVGTGTRDLYAVVGNTTTSPIGWIQFCMDHEDECHTKHSAPRDIVLSATAWRDLQKVNSWANDTIKPITDIEHWGTIERWSYPKDGYGDCEDYALLKRRMLIDAGWPREALLMTVVRDKAGEGHAVLTVKTDRGEFILDNETSEILPWTKTGYRLIKRQSQSDPNTWVTISAPEAPSILMSAR
jgi:predicted transglutaminase-like cysteine proteinase